LDLTAMQACAVVVGYEVSERDVHIAAQVRDQGIESSLVDAITIALRE